MGGLTFNTSFSDILILIKYIFMEEILRRIRKLKKRFTKNGGFGYWLQYL